MSEGWAPGTRRIGGGLSGHEGFRAARRPWYGAPARGPVAQARAARDPLTMDRPPPHGPTSGPRRLVRLAAALAASAVAGTLATLAGVAAPGGEQLDATRERIRALEAEVSAIDARAIAAADAHAGAVRRAQALRERIARTTDDLAEARRAHAVSVQRLSDRVVALYRAEEPTLIEVVLTTGDLSEALDAQRALEQISLNDRRIVTRLEETRERLTALRRRLRASRGEVEAQVRERAARLAELEGLIAERRAALDEAQAALDELIRREERAREAAAARRRAAAAAVAAEEAAERRLRRRADPGSSVPSAAASSAPDPAPTPAAPSGPAPAGDVAAHLARIAQCESGGNPRAVSSSGLYRGKYQFSVGTWQSVGGVGDPAAAPEAEQDRRAAILYARSGPAPWPVCGYR